MELEIKCNRCGSKNYIYAGWGWRKGIKNVHRRRCCNCGKIYVMPNGVLTKDKEEKTEVK